MRAFLIVAGTVFGLLVLAHILRAIVEPSKATDPWYWAITAVAAALSVWAWVLVWRLRRV